MKYAAVFVALVIFVAGCGLNRTASVEGQTETQGKKYIERAESAADNVKERLRDINKRAQEAD